MGNNKMKAIAVILILGLLAGVMIWKSGGSISDTNEKDVLQASFLKVGKADAIVIQEKDHTMVIDVGEEEDGEEVVAFLQNQGISYVDTLIITHYDQDHVGGADTLVESVEVGEVLLPDYDGVSTEYVDFMKALENAGICPKRLKEPVEFSFGTANVLVEPPKSYEVSNAEAENDNNFSLITTIVHGEKRMVFTGDMEKQRIREWITGESAVPCDFLKVPHHGVYNKALKDLFATLQPKSSVICSSNKNPADVHTLELLKEFGVQIYQTKDGNITLLSDGKNLEIHQKLEE